MYTVIDSLSHAVFIIIIKYRTHSPTLYTHTHADIYSFGIFKRKEAHCTVKRDFTMAFNYGNSFEYLSTIYLSGEQYMSLKDMQVTFGV